MATVQFEKPILLLLKKTPLQYFSSTPKGFINILGRPKSFSTCKKPTCTQLPTHQAVSVRWLSHTPGDHPTILSRMSHLEDRMRFYGYSTIRIGLGVAVIVGIGGYAFREYIRENVACEVSTVARKSLENEVVKIKAQELAIALANAILLDPKLQEETVDLLKRIFSQKEVIDGLSQLLIDVLSNRTVRASLTQTLKHLMTASLQDEAFRASLADSLQWLLQEETTKSSLLGLLAYAFQDEHVKSLAAQFAMEVLNTKVVQEEAIRLGKVTVSGVVADSNVQKQTGDAMWSAFAYSLVPSWLSTERSKPSTESGNEPP